MSEANYNQVISDIKNLNLKDQLRILEEIAIMIRRNTSDNASRSILELKGKGKDIWKCLDVAKYIEEERSSWNG